MKNNNAKKEINEFDKAKFISEYEAINNIPFKEHITTHFNDYALDNFRDGVDENTINETYNKALEFIGITEDELVTIIKQPYVGLIKKYYHNRMLKNNNNNLQN